MKIVTIWRSPDYYDAQALLAEDAFAELKNASPVEIDEWLGTHARNLNQARALLRMLILGVRFAVRRELEQQRS